MRPGQSSPGKHFSRPQGLDVDPAASMRPGQSSPGKQQYSIFLIKLVPQSFNEAGAIKPRKTAKGESE